MVKLKPDAWRVSSVSIQNIQVAAANRNRVQEITINGSQLSTHLQNITEDGMNTIVYTAKLSLWCSRETNTSQVPLNLDFFIVRAQGSATFAPIDSNSATKTDRERINAGIDKEFDFLHIKTVSLFPKPQSATSVPWRLSTSAVLISDIDITESVIKWMKDFNKIDELVEDDLFLIAMAEGLALDNADIIPTLVVEYRKVPTAIRKL